MTLRYGKPADADLSAEFAFHLNHDRIGTVLGVNPPT